MSDHLPRSLATRAQAVLDISEFINGHLDKGGHVHLHEQKGNPTPILATFAKDWYLMVRTGVRDQFKTLAPSNGTYDGHAEWSQLQFLDVDIRSQ
jgi:hypothetical protein